MLLFLKKCGTIMIYLLFALKRACGDNRIVVKIACLNASQSLTGKERRFYAGRGCLNAADKHRIRKYRECGEDSGSGKSGRSESVV